MALTFGFYNSMGGDRRYNATQVSELFDGLITDGVFHSVDDILTTVPGEGLQVILKSGKAWFNHTWNKNDAPIPFALAQPDMTLARLDALVLEVNSDPSVRANRFLIIKGTAATTPLRPVLTNTETLHQHPLAYIRVRGAATKIEQSDIEVVVGKNECPFVTGILTAASIEDLFQQWNGQFYDWWDTIKATLDENVVTNLQNQINKLSIMATKEELEAGTQAQIRAFSPSLLNDAIKTISKNDNDVFVGEVTTTEFEFIPVTVPYVGTGVWQKVVFLGNKFIAIGNMGKAIMYSNDGITWNNATVPAGVTDSNVWYDIAYSGSTYVVVGNGGGQALYSSNGITWTITTLPNSGTAKQIVYGNGLFVAVSNAASTALPLYYSSNGITWTAATVPSFPTSAQFSTMAYGNGLFVVASMASSNARIVYSTNGSTWTMVSAPIQPIAKVLFGAGVFILLCASSYTQTAYSTNGSTWTTRTLPVGIHGQTAVSDGTQFLAPTQDSGKPLAHSSDGITWTAISTLKLQLTNLFVGSTPGTFVGATDTAIAVTNKPLVSWDVYPSQGATRLAEDKGRIVGAVTSMPLRQFVYSGYVDKTKSIIKNLAGDWLGSFIRVEEGWYVGDGNYGNASPNRLVLSIKPKLLFIFGSTGYSTILSAWVDQATVLLNNSVQGMTGVVFSDNLVEWYAAGSTATQLNTAGRVYRYLAMEF